MNAQYLAGFELSQANIEQLVFDNVATVRDQKPGSTDPNDHMAARLNADNPATAIGTSIMLKTMPGDRFNISVDALYEGDYRQVNELSGNDIVRSLMTTLTGGANYDGVPVSELPDNVKTIQSIFNNPNLATQIDQLTNAINDVNAPKAHLNYLFFDDRFNLVAGSSGSMQVVPGTSGWQTIVPGGGNNGVVYCASCSTPGYLVAYIDNETIGKDVWFDHFMVGHYTSAVVAEDHYYPFGLTVSMDQNPNVTKNPYKLTTKELESKFDLNLYDFGARMQDMQLGRWMSIDPLAEKYFGISPYNFCANNPVNYVDLDGRKIDPASQSEWDIQKQNITDKRDESQARLNITNAYNSSLQDGAPAASTASLDEKVKSLNGSLANLSTLESSNQTYTLQNVGTTVNGGTNYDNKTGNIVFAYGTTANFIHETTHGGQFESGDLGFNINTGGVIGVDLGDEVSAYKAQAAYDISSVSKLGSSSVANSIGAVTSTWVQSLVDNTGSKPYSVGGSANTGLTPINKNSTRADLIKAYPNATGLQSLPVNFILNSVPTYKFKP